jgi:hypothetical protein
MADKVKPPRPGETASVPKVELARPLSLEQPIYTAQVAPAHVVLDRGGFAYTFDELLWEVLKDRTAALSFSRYSQFIDNVFRDAATGPQAYDMESLSEILKDTRLSDSSTKEAFERLQEPELTEADSAVAYNFLIRKAEEVLARSRDGLTGRSPRNRVWSSNIFNGEAYELLKAATEFYVYAEAGRLEEVGDSESPHPSTAAGPFAGAFDSATLGTFKDDYLVKLEGEVPVTRVLPYLAIIRRRLSELPIKKGLALGVAPGSYGILRSRLTSPILVELIWNYWIEQGLMVQTINLVALRFQNVRRGPGVDPLANLEIDPLRPLSNLLWGYLQDELNRLSVQRRAYEYAHGLGLQLVGKAIPEMHPADVRSQFLPAFHDLLRLAWIFFREDDDKTIAADAFPLLNALRELHFVISEGAHNQFGDLPLRARIEMLIQQWILGRPEMRDFLRGRTMVPYPEPWMDRVDAMKALQGWNDASVINYADLATLGEQIILSVRYGSWSTTNDQNQAANWARAWRSVIQRYTHALRIVSGIDLSVGDVAEVRTSTERLAQGISAGRGATPGGTFNFPPAPGARSLPSRPGADKLLRPAQPAGVRVRPDGQGG